MVHFEVYVQNLGIHHTASPGKDTVHQLVVARVGGEIVRTQGADKWPATSYGSYRNRGKHKGGCELKDIGAQWNADIKTNDPIVFSILVANIAHGTESYMEQILNIIQGRHRSHAVLGPGASSSYGLKVAGPKTEGELDEFTAEMVRKFGEEIGKLLGHGVDHFKNASKNHDCVVLYDTITITDPLAWQPGKEVTVYTIRGLSGLTRGHPEYSANVVIKRH